MSEAPVQEGAVRSILKKAITTLENVSSVVIFVMMVLTFVDVIGRYAFHKPIFGGTEIISALLALSIFSGLGVINARDDHITVELFEEAFRWRLTPIVYEVLVQLFSVVAMSLIAAVLFEHAWEGYKLKKLTEVLEMPVYYTSGAIAVFAVISVLSQITGVVLKILDLSAGRKRNAP